LLGLLQVGLGRHLVTDCRDLVTQVNPDDVGALLSEADGMGPALAARHPSDEGDLSVE
jgi:hypothetical protein